MRPSTILPPPVSRTDETAPAQHPPRGGVVVSRDTRASRGMVLVLGVWVSVTAIFVLLSVWVGGGL